MIRLRVIDTETCGVEPPDMQIVEVATLDLVSENERDWIAGEHWSYLVNPGRQIPVTAMAVHHITNEMVATSPPIADVAADLLTGDPTYFVAHNARFDLKVMAENNVILDAAMPWLCTYKAAIVLWPHAPSHKNQVLRYFLGLDVHSVRQGEWTGSLPHRAVGDVMVTAAIAREVLKSMTLDEWAAVSAKPALLPRVHFGEHEGKQWADVPESYLYWMLFKSKGEWDEDVKFTAEHHYNLEKIKTRSRSPV